MTNLERTLTGSIGKLIAKIARQLKGKHGAAALSRPIRVCNDPFRIGGSSYICSGNCLLRRTRAVLQWIKQELL